MGDDGLWLNDGYWRKIARTDRVIVAWLNDGLLMVTVDDRGAMLVSDGYNDG